MRAIFQRIVCWYLRRVESFHCYDYGTEGRYVAMMNETEYAQFQAYIRGHRKFPVALSPKRCPECGTNLRILHYWCDGCDSGFKEPSKVEGRL